MTPQRLPYTPLGRPLKQGSLKDDPLLFREELSPSTVAWALAQWPLPRLQHISSGILEVLWVQQRSWETQLKKDRNSRIPRALFATDDSGLPIVPLIDGALESLLRLSPLVKPLVEIRWRNDVRTWNRPAEGADENWSIDQYLFPDSTRLTIPKNVHRSLGEIQQGCCFWCEKPLKGKARHADHVVPWSRSLNNNIENLVISDGYCNSIKSDRLISPTLARRWASHVDRNRDTFKGLARSNNLHFAPNESLAWLISLTRTATGEVDYFDVSYGEPTVRRARASAVWPLDISWLGTVIA